jgi:AraC-like DNA-binding protein
MSNSTARRTAARPSAAPARGILRASPAAGTFDHQRLLPSIDLQEIVEHYWMVRWDLRGHDPYLAETLPHPTVHWTTADGRSIVRGIVTGRFSQTLDGRGRVFGVKFRPGAFHPFLKEPVSTLTDRTRPLSAVFGRAGRTIEKQLCALDATALATDHFDRRYDEEMMALVEDFLRARRPDPDPTLRSVTTIVDRIMGDRDITKVDDVVARFGINKRHLQRLFSHYVGVSPKWVIKRYRMHEAVERAVAGRRVSWSGLAADLGYFDQTHFIKDFKALIGKSPAEYVRAQTMVAGKVR